MAINSVADMKCVVFPTGGAGAGSVEKSDVGDYLRLGIVDPVSLVTSFITATVTVVGSLVAKKRAEEMQRAIEREAEVTNQAKRYLRDTIGGYNQKAWDIENSGYTTTEEVILSGVITSMSSEELAGIVNDGNEMLELLFPMTINHAVRHINQAVTDAKAIDSDYGTETYFKDQNQKKSDIVSQISKKQVGNGSSGGLMIMGVFSDMISKNISKVKQKPTSGGGAVIKVTPSSGVSEIVSNRIVEFNPRIEKYGFKLIRSNKTGYFAIAPIGIADDLQIQINKGLTLVDGDNVYRRAGAEIHSDGTVQFREITRDEWGGSFSRRDQRYAANLKARGDAGRWRDALTQLEFLNDAGAMSWIVRGFFANRSPFKLGAEYARKDFQSVVDVVVRVNKEIAANLEAQITDKKVSTIPVRDIINDSVKTVENEKISSSVNLPLLLSKTGRWWESQSKTKQIGYGAGAVVLGFLAMGKE